MYTYIHTRSGFDFVEHFITKRTTFKTLQELVFHYQVSSKGAWAHVYKYPGFDSHTTYNGLIM